MTQPQRLLLAREAHRARLRQAFQQAVQLSRLFAFRKKALNLIGVIEMILEDVLAAARHEDELLDSGLARFLDGLSNDGLVHHRQHLFGDGLGGGQKARAHACDRENSFADRLGLRHLAAFLKRSGYEWPTLMAYWAAVSSTRRLIEAIACEFF